MGLIAKAAEWSDERGSGVSPSLRVARWLRLLTAHHPEDGTLELRCLNVTRKWSSATHTEISRYPATREGRDQFARDAVRINLRASGCYWNLNPLVSGLGHNATDADVVRRVWLPIDIDPIRPKGLADQSSTEDERAHAWLLFLAIRNHLAGLGWAAPIQADSGNGYHLLYRIDLPSADEGLVQGCLAALSQKFSTPEARVDPGVFNPSRIWKLYGTFARKGEATKERPFREASILNECYPDGPGLVTREQLERLAAEAAGVGTNGKHVGNGKTTSAAVIPIRRGSLIARAVDADDVMDRARAYLDECEPAVSGQHGHDTTFRVAATVGPGFDLDEDACVDLLLRYYNPRCQPPWSEKEIRHKVSTAYRKEERRGWLRDAGVEPESPASGKRGPGRPRSRPEPVTVTDPETGLVELADDPHRLGRLYLKERHSHDEGWLLRYWDEQWHAWDGSCWRVRKDREVLAELTRHAKEELNRVAAGAGEPAKAIGTRLIGNVAQALRGEVLLRLPDVPAQPAWLDAREGDHDPREYLPASNGLVHLPTLIAAGDEVLRPLTPRYFAPSSLAYPFDPEAGHPGLWLRFLNELWPDDPDSIACLQEWFGYLLTLDTSLQKILLLVGPKRSGKGTITRTLVQLLGHDNHAAPTLASLADRFGLSSLIGRQLAVVPEARLSGRADSQTIVERLLSISGEDPQSIDRKHLTAWHGRLLCRFVLLGNELPRLGDHSGALASRLIVLRLERSFLGQEDLRLTEKLQAELPAILLWSIEGLKRLLATGRFTIPESSRELTEEFEKLSNPVGAFLEDVCDLGPDYRVLAGDLYQAWVKWCEDQGRERPGDQQGFGRSLRAALPRLKTTQPRSGESRVRYYLGIKLKSQSDDPDVPF